MTNADEAALLFVNEAFYLAFQTHDMRAMDALWSNHHSVQCIHPGWPPLFGREAVMESWLRILSNRAAPNVTFSHAVASPLGEFGLVICHERVADNSLVATNMFHRSGREWRIIHHQSSPAPEPDEREPPRAPRQRLQ